MGLERLELLLDQKIKELFEKSVPRYYPHTLQVVANMKKIMESSPLDKKVLLTSAYLHDIGYSAPYGKDFVGNIESQKLKIRLHCETGANITRSILTQMKVEPEIIEKVANLVLVHHQEKPKEDYLKLLIEADKV